MGMAVEAGTEGRALRMERVRECAHGCTGVYVTDSRYRTAKEDMMDKGAGED